MEQLFCLLNMNELLKEINDCICSFNDIKNEIRRIFPGLYERWKAGGFLVDDNIVSMYPNLNDIYEFVELEAQLEDEDEDEEGDEDEV